jgi:hypothetical protein
MIDSFLKAFASAAGFVAGFFAILFVAGLCMRLSDALDSRKRESLVERVRGER